MLAPSGSDPRPAGQQTDSASAEPRPSSPPVRASSVISTITSLTTCGGSRPAPAGLHFLAPAVGADEQQVYQVIAPIAIEPARPIASIATWTDLGNMIGVEGDHDRSKTGVGHRLGLGIVHFQCGVLRVDLRLSLRQRGGPV